MFAVIDETKDVWFMANLPRLWRLMLVYSFDQRINLSLEAVGRRSELKRSVSE